MASDAARRGVDRLAAFSDGVVAIAITLIVLPLVDAARDLDGGSVSGFLGNNATRLIAAAISFVVIGAFWRDHHRLFERATGCPPLLLRVNLLWLAGVVFLPVATVLYNIIDERSSPMQILTAALPVLFMVMALATALIFPNLGLWPVLILLVVRPIAAVTQKRPRRP